VADAAATAAADYHYHLPYTGAEAESYRAAGSDVGFVMEQARVRSDHGGIHRAAGQDHSDVGRLSANICEEQLDRSRLRVLDDVLHKHEYKVGAYCRILTWKIKQRRMLSKRNVQASHLM